MAQDRLDNAICRGNARLWMENFQQNHLMRPSRFGTPDSPTSFAEFGRATIKRPRN